ncbi:MAG: hypothetical protein PHI72_06455 [Atribacterota bacterium]|nr:hypothetical protein [Atribacterota bacterium]MDD4895654.1 hypothetical protein [Atribacterota bacterium]MDD5637346.1 hypothetical protein [Atribacterota bacterium]
MNNKNIFNIYWCILLIIFLAGTLSIQAEEVVQESQYLGEISLCKDVKENNPIFETSSFSIWDEKVVCWIRFNYFSLEEFNIIWEWEDPQGNIFHVGELGMEPGNYQNYRSWYWIGIRDRYAVNLPGDWKVRIYIDNVLLAVKDFTIS